MGSCVGGENSEKKSLEVLLAFGKRRRKETPVRPGTFLPLQPTAPLNPAPWEAFRTFQILEP